MKLVRCEWAPSLVVEWLCGELEDRGIPGPTYAHTLLSLLHHHYCPHPPPVCPAPASPAPAAAAPDRHYHHPLSRRHLDDFDLRDLDLEDLLGYTTHPDADLPDLAAFTPQQRGESRRARKRHKVRQKHRILTSEQLQKVAALQCLMSASDERYDLESLVEELCLRLKTAAENEHMNASNSIQSCLTKKPVSLKSVVTHKCIDTDDYASSSTPEEQAEKYYAAFPALSGSSKDKCGHEEAKKSDVVCPCVFEAQKSSRVGPSEVIQVSKMPRNHRKKFREKAKKEMDTKYEGREESTRRHITFTWNSGKHKEAKRTENYDTDSASEPERNIERRRKKFIAPLLDEDIGEGYIGDASSRESSEDRDKGDQVEEKPREDKGDKNSNHSAESKGKICKEEWECMGYFLLGTSDNEGKNPSEGGGSRLYERGTSSDGTSGSSSDLETQEDESVRQLERKISNTVPQVWGQVGELVCHGGEHVWDPPAVQEMALYTTIWGFNLPNQHGIESSVFDESLSNKFNESKSPVNDGWHQQQQQCSWPTAVEDESLVCSIKNHSPQSGVLKSGNEHSFEKSMWSDCNANDITGSDCSVPILDNTTVHEEREDNIEATEDLQKKLLESFMQLSLENIWDPEDIHREYSNCNLEENESFDEGVKDAHLDSDHEKMRALVEDVCKSFESHEGSSLSCVVKPVPSGPAGPHADLHHTEQSGFSMVVPRSKSAESNSPDLHNDSLLSQDDDKSQEGISNRKEGDTVVAQEEENLLTSPRTHFRPIRQDSTGSTADDHYEDGTMFLVNSDRPDLPFQRTGSGALFLESDLLEGSPKKYMVYKEPTPKVVHPEDQQENKTTTAIQSFPAIALVPKFKVVNNEKFCQTEEEGVRQSFSKRDKISVHYTEDEKEPDVFEFQLQDFPDSSNLSSIWKAGLESDPGTLENIWKVQQVQDSEELWTGLSGICKEKGIVGSVWQGKEDGAAGWSKDSNYESDDHNTGKSGAVLIPSSLASLWHPGTIGSSPESPIITSSLPSLQELWASFASSEDFKSGETRRYIITNPTTHMPGKIPENCRAMPSIIDVGPWKPTNGEDDATSKSEQIWMDGSLSSSQKHLNSGDQAMVCGVGLRVDCTQLRLEVDEEADELLGAVHAQTSSSQDHASFSPRPLHERLKKRGKPLQMNIEGPVSQEYVEREDLDDLAPDWELNDGFEWEPQAVGPQQDYQDGVCENDDDGGGSEVIIWESEGTTYTLPVEYLEDSLYDQIFGAVEAGSRRLGGSLPDLPSGHPASAVHFSNDLEEKWKKSGIPYKVQLPRKPRTGGWVPPSRRPCTFFMEGGCRRHDCRFSHDLASITCRFWEDGSCLKGITCPFLHGYPLRRRRNKSEGAAHSQVAKVDKHSSPFEIDNEMDFPALGSSCESKCGSVEEHGSLNIGTSSTHPPPPKKKKRKFITITKNVLGQIRPSDGERGVRGMNRRERGRRHTENTGAAPDLHSAAATSTIAPKPEQRPVRKTKRHRALASGHDDGTVSDY